MVGAGLTMHDSINYLRVVFSFWLGRVECLYLGWPHRVGTLRGPIN
jgi:hypothetical protein